MLVRAFSGLTSLPPGPYHALLRVLNAPRDDPRVWHGLPIKPELESVKHRINQSINQSIKQSVNQTIKNNQTFVELWPVKSPPIQQSNKKPIHLSINYQLTPGLPINQTITPIIQVGPLCTKPVVKEAIKQPIRK